MKESSDPARAGLLALYGSIFLLALNGLFAKLIPLDAVSMTQSRSVVACLVLFLVLAFQRTSLRLSSIKQCVGVYGLGVLLGLHWITYFYAMQVSSVAIGMLSLFSYPVITVVIEPIFKQHFPYLKDLFAALIVFLGVFLMVSQDVFRGNLGSSAVQGAVWGILSAVLFSVRNTTQKYLFPHINSMTLMAHQTLAIALMLLPFINMQHVSDMKMTDWGLLVLLGCFSTAMAHTFLTMSLKRLPAKSVGLISCNTPVVGAIIAALVLQETPEFMVCVGGAVILSVAAWETINHNK